MRNFAMIVCVGLALSGCMSQASQEGFSTYGKQMPAMFKDATTGKTFAVWDRPQDGKLAIGSSFGDAVAAGALFGATLGTVDKTPGQMVSEDVAVRFLTSNGRTCAAVDSSEISKTVYEVIYTCED